MLKALCGFGLKQLIVGEHSKSYRKHMECLATGLKVQRAHSIHIRYESAKFPYQESRLGPFCVSQRLGGITGSWFLVWLDRSLGT